MAEGTNRRDFLGLIALFLGGCSFQKNIESKFPESAYCFLSEEFKRKGLHNLNSPLFDFEDREIMAAHEKTKNAYGIIERDITGKEAIERAVNGHLKRYDRSLILISGAGFHIYGAVRGLRKKGIGYVSITPKKIDFYDAIQYIEFFRVQRPELVVEKARKVLEIQLERINGVVRYYGYKNIHDFAREVSCAGEFRSIALGIEETGMHFLYKEAMGNVYDTIEDFIQKFRPSGIIYLRENMYFYEGFLRKKFEKEAANIGIPVQFERF